MKRTQLIDYSVTCVIMGGGAGTRLSPLTQLRAKPAVPLGGKFRLIDIPISNCINSGLTQIYILTQFNSAPLHRHISQSYHFDRFTRGFVEILAAQQTPRYVAEMSWYQGTADAVRKNLKRFRDTGSEEILILSGDQIYRMDFRDILATHKGRGSAGVADVTIGAVLVSRRRAGSFGVLRANREGIVNAFVEKPGANEKLYDGLEVPVDLLREHNVEQGPEPLYMANMGIYVFSMGMLDKALDNDWSDFGKEVLPALLGKVKVRAHLFRGYWEDIGTIKSFHQANLDLAAEKPQFDFYDQLSPVYTRARLLPSSRLQRVTINSALVADGCLVSDAVIERSLIGLRSIIGRGCTIRSTYVMGADRYETEEERAINRARGLPDVGIGDDTVIENAIVDKDARVGRGVRIINEKGLKEYDDGVIVIHDGIAVVKRGGVVPNGYSI